MTKRDEFVDHVLDMLTTLGAVRARAMFGGWGVYLDDVMFGLIAGDTLYFKVDNSNRGEFEAAGSSPFVYTGKNRPITMSYYEAPVDALEDRDALQALARGAVAAALRARSPDASSGRKRRARR
ncbi:MAG: TfoX/Sxy family protein [Alphaproteobacteria bacterium]